MSAYNTIQKVYLKNYSEIQRRITNSKFPVTCKTLHNFYLRIEDLLQSLEGMKSNKNFYSSRALTRVTQEHFLVAYYIWTKWRIEKSDDCAIDYMKYYAAFELIKQVNYNSKLDKTYNVSKTPLENFLIKKPEFSRSDDPLSQKDFDEINKRGNKFDIRKVLQYMQTELDSNDPFKSLQIIVHDVCENYNMLSSYVHGGRLAELETYEETPLINKEKILEDNVEVAKTFSFHILSCLLLIFCEEDKSFFFDVYMPVFLFLQLSSEQNQQIISKITNNPLQS